MGILQLDTFHLCCIFLFFGTYGSVPVAWDRGIATRGGRVESDADEGGLNQLATVTIAQRNLLQGLHKIFVTYLSLFLNKCLILRLEIGQPS
jgi:hypothetical protein